MHYGEEVNGRVKFWDQRVSVRSGITYAGNRTLRSEACRTVGLVVTLLVLSARLLYIEQGFY